MNKSEKVRELAQRIYIELCGAAEAGQAWETLASDALDAAEVFVEAFNARYDPAAAARAAAGLAPSD
jgi:hypothetical protein